MTRTTTDEIRTVFTPEFLKKIDEFCEAADQASENYFKRNVYTHRPFPLHKAEIGDKWVKVYVYERIWLNDFEKTSPDNGTKSSIYAFIVATDNETKTLGVLKQGDIHKPASYKLPAKHARGNIFQPNFRDCIGDVGIAYLR